MKYELYNKDCFHVMPMYDDGSIDMILADLPYNMTQNEWDEEEIDLDLLWYEYKRILKSTGVVALTASQPFSSKLVLSNEEMFKHEWIWKKNRGSNFANTVREPFKEHEHILIFSRGNWTYNKQMEERAETGKSRVNYDFNTITESNNYRKFDYAPDIDSNKRVPSSVQKFNVEVGLHPTQKPVPLFEYLIKTYTNEGEIVMDNVMGSGTAGVACQKLDRQFIGIEKDKDHFNTARQRIEKAADTDWDRVRGIENWKKIEGIGLKTAEYLYNKLGEIYDADLDKLESIEGIGNKTAENIREQILM